MLNLTFLLVLIHLNNQFPSLAAVKVTSCNKLCNCSEISRWTKSTVSCSSGVEMTLTDYGLPDYGLTDYGLTDYGLIDYGLTDYGRADVIIKCQQQDANLSSLLAGLNVAATRYSQVTLEACSMFNSSLSDLLASIGIRDFGKLNITLYSGSLQRKHFKNLDKVKYLIIARSDLGVLPVDIFKGLRNLEYIEIEFSSFQLTKGIFLYTPNLKKVILKRNNVSEVSFDVFNNMSRFEELEIYGTNNTSVIFDESKQYILPSLNYLLFQSIRLNTQLHVFGSALDESKLSMVENITTTLPTPLRDLILQSTKKFTLVLHNNTANLLKPRCFADLFYLQSIELTASNLKIVPEDAFSNSSNIHTVNLNSNLINSLEPNTFSDLKRLETLSISNNRISYLPEGLFSKTKSLKRLEIDHNLLKHIEPHLFSHLSKLCILNLSHNNIIYISGEQFSQLENVFEIDLSHNQLVSLVLDPLLSDLDSSVFYKCTGLRWLHLQNNSLTEIYDDWRFLLTHGRSLNLSNNGITDIQTLNITYDVTSNEFGNNKILTDYTPYNDFQDPNDEISSVINIYNNPFNCNCDLLTSLHTLYNVSLDFKKRKTLLDKVECKKPTLFENVKIIDINWTVEYKKCQQLPPDEIQKFHQGCPEACRCVYRPFTKSSVINCQNAHLQDYPRTLPVAPDADHTELSLYGNNLQEFSLPDDPGYKNVTFLNLAKNSLSTLEINGVSKKIKKLDLSHNKLKTLSVETLELLEGALELERLELHNNPWTCDVSNDRFARLVYDKKHLIRHKVACADGSPMVKTIELYLTQVNLTRREVMLYVESGVVVMILMVFILTVLYYRHRQKVHVYCFSSRWKVLRWLVSHPDYDDDDKLYDAFIIYSQEDELFVVNHLVPYLEETEDRKYKLCLHFRDWIPGEQILIQIGRSVRSSRRAIVVLSPNFLRSVWGVAEFRVAHAEALKDGTARVIVILYQDVSDDEVAEDLKAYLQTNTYVRWGSPWFWKQLTYALPHPPDSERAGLHYFSRGRRYQAALHSAEYHEMEQK